MTAAEAGGEPRGPRIAALCGPVRTGLLEDALAADLIFVSAGTTFLPRGIRPRRPGTPGRLVRRLGPVAALGFWSRTETWSAERALRAGLVDRVAADPEFSAEIVRAAWSRSPFAAGALATLRRAGERLDARSSRRLERALFSLSFADDRPRAGARAFLDGADGSGGA